MLDLGVGLLSLPVTDGGVVGGGGAPGDVTGPELQSAVIDATGLTLTLTYDEALDETSEPAPEDFALAGTDSVVDAVNVTGSTVVLTLDAAAFDFESVTLDYTADAAPIQDVAGNDAANLTAEVVINNSLVPVLGTAAYTAYIDIRDAAYDGLGQGENPGTLVPRIGAGNFVPAAGNAIIDSLGAIGGRRTVKHTSAGASPFEAHWLGTLFNGDDVSGTILARVRIDETGSKNLLGFGISSSATANYLEIFQTTTTAPYNSRLRDGVGGANVNSGSFGNLQFTDHTIAWVRNGTTVTAYVDGVAFGSPATIDVGTLSCDQFRLGASGRSNVAASIPQGFAWQVFAALPTALSAGDVAAVHDAWTAKDLPAPVGTQVALAGDSLTKGTVAGGYRKILDAWIVANAAPDVITFVGDQVNGSFSNARHMGYASHECSQIAAKVVAQCGTGKAYAPKCVILWMGTNDVNNVPGDVSAALTAYAAALDAVHAAIVTSDAAAQIMVTTLTDYLGITADIEAFNAGLPAIWDTFDTANPSNTLLRIDLYTALGPAGTSGLWAGDGIHLTDAGHQLVVDEIVAEHGAYLIGIAS